MTRETTINGGRVLARHCVELTGKAPDPERMITDFADFGVRFCRALPQKLKSLFGPEQISAELGAAEWAGVQRLRPQFGPSAANFLLNIGEGHLLLSLDLQSGLSLTDRIFGGTGLVPANLPDRLPTAADLTLTRFVRTFGSALETCLGGTLAVEFSGGGEVAAKFLRSKDLGEMLLSQCEISRSEGQPWRMALAFTRPAVAALLDETPAPRRSDQPSTSKADMQVIPLTMRAVLAQVSVPLTKITGLGPGDILPLPLPRDVPLLVGETELARGKAGTCDGAYAVHLNTISWNERTNGRD